MSKILLFLFLFCQSYAYSQVPDNLSARCQEPITIQPVHLSLNNGRGTQFVAVQPIADRYWQQLSSSLEITAGAHQVITNQADWHDEQPLISYNCSFTPPDIANYRDVRINEIMADISPPVDLPTAEFIELYNASNKTFDLAGWKYADATTATGTLPAYSLAPDSYVILCRVADADTFRPYGPVLGLTTFPALNDSGDDVRIFDNTGKLIDKISYTTATYKNSQKAGGGWSLELINPLTSCNEPNNWTASVDSAGGTPGKQNSVFNAAADIQPPTLIKAEILGNNQVILFFSEMLDTVTARNPALYTVAGGLAVTAVTLSRPLYQEVTLTMSGNWQPRQSYLITISNVRDCAGNILAPAAQATVVLPETAAVGDVVINEVLFNPRSGGVDFVEVVNRSAKYINIANWQLGNLTPDSAADKSILTTNTHILAPQEYLVLTTRPDIVQTHYPKANPAAFLRLSRLPSYPDEQGIVLLLNADNTLIDRFAYHEEMHFKLLNDINGVSLERIRLPGDSSATNWHSAASTTGYATPGYKNSQYNEPTTASQVFTIEPKIFTPDGDGDKDFTTINYMTEASGYVLNITIYDAKGREIKRLVKSELMARDGFFQWDGLDEQGRKVAVGYYVLFIEMFNLKGQVKTYKETVVVGARF